MTIEAIEQTDVSFGPTEHSWLEENRQLAAALCVKYGGGGELTPVELDVVFSRWTDDDEEKESDESVANALGAAFGDSWLSGLLSAGSWSVINLAQITQSGATSPRQWHFRFRQSPSESKEMNRSASKPCGSGFSMCF